MLDLPDVPVVKHEDLRVDVGSFTLLIVTSDLLSHDSTWPAVHCDPITEELLPVVQHGEPDDVVSRGSDLERTVTGNPDTSLDKEQTLPLRSFVAVSSPSRHN